MKITARVENTPSGHEVVVATNGSERRLAIEAKAEGRGSAVNGGELLFAALATCCCNDVYREAARLGISVTGVRVDVEGTFGGPGEPGRDIRYRVHVESRESSERIAELIRHVDTVAEIHNTLRAGAGVTLVHEES